MVRDCKDFLQTLQNTEKFQRFQAKYPSYYLAHCFIQLDKDAKVTKEWQFGFYSPKNDNLTTFVVEPAIHQGPFEEAFKDGGHIDALIIENTLPINKILEEVYGVIQDNYKHELATSYIVILQTIKSISTYNITAITQAFAMINVQINAHSGELISHKKNSILDLRKE